ncbi:sperm-associated antigen 1 [Toxorhynchites rutilus septentrionalis]|uniref:sperm-associated antigen 1 n=1 Tax=Toxorhynchites rutilus septentrionalis TaxID=329112 RepID=UPI00247B1F89|nr:sperm-associated antigen 1 [Toxorhynchites rutilus septentrionalis]
MSKRLIEKYEILLEHLDFDYIRTCENGNELEKIVKVLRSGEEGYYPDLTTFAERRLEAIKPGSKLLWKETPLGTKENLAANQWNKINQDIETWESEIKSFHADISHQKGILTKPAIPPVRCTNALASGAITPTKTESTRERIKSHEYDRWDRFDADAEILKMDLEDERQREMVNERNAANLLNTRAIAHSYHDEECFTSEEKLVLASKHREKGNDFYRSKEYDRALSEYNRSVAIAPTAAGFNNRAVTQMKLLRFKEAISDCDACLQLEPDNMKALYRKVQALISLDKRREAYPVFCKILQFDPNWKLALEGVADLRRQFPDLPPPNAFRIEIQEVSDANEAADDFAALIKPKKIIKDPLPGTVKALKTETAKMVKDTVARKQRSNNIEILSNTETNKNLIEELY